MATITSTEDTLKIEGDVSIQTVVALRLTGEEWLQKNSVKNAIVDLSGVIALDASIFSLLLCWMRFARQNKIAFSVKNMPNALQEMQKLFSLTDWFSHG